MTNAEMLEREEAEILAAHARAKRVKRMLCNKFKNSYGACTDCPFGQFVDRAERYPWRCCATPKAVLAWADKEAP